MEKAGGEKPGRKSSRFVPKQIKREECLQERLHTSVHPSSPTFTEAMSFCTSHVSATATKLLLHPGGAASSTAEELCGPSAFLRKMSGQTGGVSTLSHLLQGEKSELEGKME